MLASHAQTSPHSVSVGVHIRMLPITCVALSSFAQASSHSVGDVSIITKTVISSNFRLSGNGSPGEGYTSLPGAREHEPALKHDGC